MEKQKHFKIGDKNFYTQELTIEQDELIAGVLKEIGLDSLSDISKINLDLLMGAITQKRILRRAMSILLIPVNEEFDEKKVDEIADQVKKIRNSQVKAVLQDFLAKNPELTDLWGNSQADPMEIPTGKSPKTSRTLILK